MSASNGCVRMSDVMWPVEIREELNEPLRKLSLVYHEIFTGSRGEMTDCKSVDELRRYVGDAVRGLNEFAEGARG